MPQNTSPLVKKQKLNLSIDLRIVSIALVLIILGMLAAWRPWSSVNANDQVVEVTGDAKLSATPDEYTFYPAYRFTDPDKDTSLAQLTTKSNEVVAGLKKLGVADQKIKTNSNGYDYPVVPEGGTETEASYNLQLTITVGDTELAQKVQDYLLTTTPSGEVTPQASFSEKKRKQLESSARDEATKDARVKADQMAKNLGFNVGSVKSVSDSQGFGVFPLFGRDVGTTDSLEAKSQLALQPGENELNYSVKVVYYIR